MTVRSLYGDLIFCDIYNVFKDSISIVYNYSDLQMKSTNVLANPVTTTEVVLMTSIVMTAHALMDSMERM